SALPIVIPANAEEEIRTSAADLADILGRSLNVKVDIVEGGPAERGIVLTTAGRLPEALSTQLNFDTDNVAQRERYVIHHRAEGPLLVGATPLAVQHAAAHLLHRLGYRQYFTSPNWEILPTGDTLAIDFAIESQPDFKTRIIAIGN